MAYDGFQQGPNPYAPPEGTTSINTTEGPPPPSFNPQYPYHSNTDQINMPQPQVPPPNAAPPQSYYSEPPREQTTWGPPAPPQAGRINEAVTSAVGNSGSSGYISPELLSQITATVIQQLRATGFDNTLSHQQQPSQPPPPQWAPPASSYAPPEPASPHPSIYSHGTPPPTSRPAPETGSYQYPPPPQSAGASHLYPRSSPAPPQERRESPSQLSDQSQKADSRPKVVRTDTFPTTLEKIWGKLFEDGKPTERLGQFLRGIATHLIENYPPGNTLVVVPQKLQKFYADTIIPSDPYPWQDIFDDHTSSISRLFREVEAEHHLVQSKLNERPDIPGLTPRGFEVWATLMIRAHPDKEYERLQKAVLNMPISNPDNRKERFPKDIPRRLFPETPDLTLREELDQYIMKHCGVDLPPISDEEIKRVAAQRHKASASPAVSAAESTHSVNERERKPYYPPAVVDDDDEEEPSHPTIERKRKPYTAQPGGGKVYEGPGTPTHRHSNSFSSAGLRDSRGPSTHRPPESPTLRSGSRAPQRSGTYPRSRSQSRGFHPGHEYRHSEGDLLNNGRSSRNSGDYYYNTSSTIPADLLDDTRQYRDPDRSAEDQRLYEQVREREKEREKSKYHDGLPSRSSWAGEEDYYRGMLGGQGGSGYDYKSYR